MTIVTGFQLDLVLLIRTQSESNWFSMHFIDLFSLCLTNVAIVILNDTIDGFAKIKVNILYYSSFVHSTLVTLSPKAFMLVRPSLPSINTHWVDSHWKHTGCFEWPFCPLCAQKWHLRRLTPEPSQDQRQGWVACDGLAPHCSSWRWPFSNHWELPQFP